MSNLKVLATVGCTAVLLALLFWWPLVRGGGLVGGDVYSYYLPQKVVYAEGIREGRIPLWNNRTGHGYPLVAESQTGPFYPFHLLFYRTLPANSAYNANHLSHYLLAFVFMGMYARAVGLSLAGSLLAALVFTYAWFPSRCCWEWAIIGGAWMPLCLWCVERFLQTQFWRYAILLSVALALQMLAGHYNLAFITQVLLAAYIPGRLWLANGDLADQSRRSRATTTTILIVAAGCSFCLAAAQLLPTWELKGVSQREVVGADHPVAHGSIPTWYWSQALAPWKWYSPLVDRDAALRDASDELGALTNQVEAHLYFGLVPLGLAAWGLVAGVRKRERLWWLWTAIGALALIYTSGRLLPLTEHLPGFNFFQGPGRFGILTTLSVALLAGRGLRELETCRSSWGILACGLFVAAAVIGLWLLVADTEDWAAYVQTRSPLTLAGMTLRTEYLLGLAAAVSLATLWSLRAASPGRSSRVDRTGRANNKLPADTGPPTDTARPTDTSQPSGALRWTLVPLLVIVFLTTAVDLWIVSRLVTYSQMVDDPPIAHLQQSPVGRILKESGIEARLFAPLPNLPSTLASALPVYLTFGPAVYESDEYQPPENDEARIAWMKRAGVTHILSVEPLDERKWPVERLWQGSDPFLNPALAMFRQPLYLYEFHGARGRAFFAEADQESRIQLVELTPEQITVEVSSEAGGQLVLSELMYPGWQVTVDGEPAEAGSFEDIFRAVDVESGAHTVVWTYHSRGVYWGAALAVAAILFLAIIAHVRFWHPGWLPFPNGKPSNGLTTHVDQKETRE